MLERFGKRWLPFWAAILSVSLLLGLAVSPAMGAGPAQPPRPPLEGGGGGGGEGGGEKGGGGQPPPKYAVVRGEVVNWGYRNEPGVKLTLGDGGWELTQLTSDSGRYLFGPLGGGLAILRLNLPDNAPLKAAAGDVVLQTTGDYEDDIVANFALYSGEERPKPPAHLTVTATPTSVRPGDRVTFEFKIQNDLPNGISKVKLLYLLPWELIPTEIQGNRGSVMICDDPINKHVGRLVTVNLGEVAQGAVQELKIVAALDKQAASGAELEARATLLYAESIMDQQVVKVNSGGELPKAVAGGRPSKLPATGAGIPLAAVGLAAVVLLTRRLRSRPQK
jgi:hypothetical protein